MQDTEISLSHDDDEAPLLIWEVAEKPVCYQSVVLSRLRKGLRCQVGSLELVLHKCQQVLKWQLLPFGKGNNRPLAAGSRRRLYHATCV